MSTEIKPVLILVLMCVTILFMGMVKVEKEKNKSSEASLNNIVSEDFILEDIEQELKTVESSTFETIEEQTEKTEIIESSQIQTTESDTVETPTDYDNCNVPSNNSIKSYMDYRFITSTNSKQYKLQHSLAYTGNHGIRMVGERYCVAVGSYYTTTIGQHIDVELENGNIIQGIVADCKDDAHTDSTNRINPNGSVVEFVVDTEMLDDTAKIMGDISYVNDWNSKVVNIKVYDIVEEF